jgi:hypothetical protein
MNIKNLSKEQVISILKQSPRVLLKEYTTSQLKELMALKKSYQNNNTSPPLQNIQIKKETLPIPSSPPKISSPPITSQLKNLAEDSIKWIKNGMHIVSDKSYKDRLNVCLNCEFWEKHTSGPFDGRCLKCGCTSLKLKLNTTHCPVGKWGPLPHGV